MTSLPGMFSIPPMAPLHHTVYHVMQANWVATRCWSVSTRIYPCFCCLHPCATRPAGQLGDDEVLVEMKRRPREPL